jgi:hypothetical protein
VQTDRHAAVGVRLNGPPPTTGCKIQDLVQCYPIASRNTLTKWHLLLRYNIPNLPYQIFSSFLLCAWTPNCHINQFIESKSSVSIPSCVNLYSSGYATARRPASAPDTLPLAHIEPMAQQTLHNVRVATVALADDARVPCTPNTRHGVGCQSQSMGRVTVWPFNLEHRRRYSQRLPRDIVKR